MAWTDQWKYIRYGVVTLIGMAATVGVYVTWPTGEYVTTDEYAAVLLGTVERCQATATGYTITTNTSTNVTFGYAADPSGRCWGGTNVYLVPVYETNVVTAVITNWTYAAAPPAIVSTERVTVGRVIASLTTNGASIFTNDSPAVYTNAITNALTPYVPAGALLALWNAASNAIPYYINTNSGVDAWTVTGMFAACGFPGWDTNSGPDYVAKTNVVQLYAVLEKMRVRSFTPGGRLSFAGGPAKGVQGYDFVGGLAAAQAEAEGYWPASESNPYSAAFDAFGVWTRNLWTFTTDFTAWAAHDSARPVYWFYDHSWEPPAAIPSNGTFRLSYVVMTNMYTGSDAVRTFDAQGTDLVMGTNTVDFLVTSYSYADGKHTFTCAPVYREPSPTFDLNWGDSPTTQGVSILTGFLVDELSLAFPSPAMYRPGFLYATNAPP